MRKTWRPTGSGKSVRATGSAVAEAKIESLRRVGRYRASWFMPVNVPETRRASADRGMTVSPPKSCDSRRGAVGNEGDGLAALPVTSPWSSTDRRDLRGAQPNSGIAMRYAEVLGGLKTGRATLRAEFRLRPGHRKSGTPAQTIRRTPCLKRIIRASSAPPLLVLHPGLPRRRGSGTNSRCHRRGADNHNEQVQINTEDALLTVEAEQRRPSRRRLCARSGSRQAGLHPSDLAYGPPVPQVTAVFEDGQPTSLRAAPGPPPQKPKKKKGFFAEAAQAASQLRPGWKPQRWVRSQLAWVKSSCNTLNPRRVLRKRGHHTRLRNLQRLGGASRSFGTEGLTEVTDHGGLRRQFHIKRCPTDAAVGLRELDDA